jgi:hypothetical protein
MTAEQTTTPCMYCHARPAQVMATRGGDEPGCAALCGDCAIEDKSTRVAIGTPPPIYSRFVQPAQQRLFDDAAQAMRRWVAADRAVVTAFVDTDVLIGLLNTPPWPGRAAAA